MRDQMNRNPMTVASAPSLASGALLIDTNQALTFDGSTDTFSVTDSPTMSFTSSMSVEFFLKFSALPGSTKTIAAKASSYTVQLNTAGKILFRLDNGGSNVTVTSSAALSTNTWYHIVCVYNEEYSGTQQFGKTDTGASSSLQLLADDTKYVTSFTCSETGLLDTVYLSLNYVDEVHAVDVRALVYSDTASAPDALVAQSDAISVNDSSLWRNPTFVAFPVSRLIPAGTYWLGAMASDPYPTNGLYLTGDSSGGTTKTGADTFSDGAEDPFGTIASSNSNLMSAYATYTAIGRTGLEGKAAIYINGAIDNSSAYTSGIADNANAFTHATTDAAVTIDELSVWDRVLSAVEIANHYRMR